MKKNLMNFKNIFIPALVGGLLLASCADGRKSADETLTTQEVVEQKVPDEPVGSENEAIAPQTAEDPTPEPKETASKSTINKNFLIGSWQDQSRAALDFTLFADGTAKSDNMQSLLYQRWRVQESRLYLTVKSVGNGTSSTRTDVYDIQKLTERQMILKRGKLVSTYKKINKKVETPSAEKGRVVRGELTAGHEANVFKPCGMGKEFWFTDKTGKLATLYSKLTVGKKPYTPIFAEIEIIEKGKATEGFPAEYDGVYEVVRVLNTRKKSDKDCL
jgi:hypothetical protein